ncbi:hypothetical protein IC619_009310 [Hazenella sp. IB182353]|uniref:hypothetical protein n=1 Tax=Polycladospora coralii TaxID=2771432 RepID=UPI00174635B3|nr:hypothetical protein [Polycladospora coralii]MBS7530689.1 hypothetical protein [Polycladospora coralii]
MDYHFYRLAGENEIQFSISLATDILYWQRQNKAVIYLGTTEFFADVSVIQNEKELPALHTKKIMLQQIQMDLVKSGLDDLLHYLQGRMLKYAEIQHFVIQNGKIPPALLNDILQLAQLEGKVKLVSGVVTEGARMRWFCSRCKSGYKDIVNATCKLCENTCVRCMRCLKIGESKSCQPVYIFQNDIKQAENKKTQLSISYQITPLQEHAVARIQLFLNSELEKLHLWSVVDSGRTTILIYALLEMLKKNKVIGWVIAHVDHLKEKYEQLSEMLTQTSICAIGGDNEYRYWDRAQIYLVTKYQLYRFHHFFDVIIVDSVYAQRMSDDFALQQVIKRTCTERAKTIFLTNTKPYQFHKIHRDVKQDWIHIAARYHGEPVTVPRLVYVNNLKDKLYRKQEIFQFRQIISSMQRTDSLLFIVRNERAGHMLSSWFQQLDKQKSNLISILIAPVMKHAVKRYTHIVVIEAESTQYSDARLFHLASCVRRGRLYLVSNEKTIKLMKLIQQIKIQNYFAEKRGFEYKKVKRK